MTHDLVPRAIQHRHLTLEDRDERVGRVTDLIQLLAHLGRELLAALGKQRELSTRKHPSRNCHRIISVKRHMRDKRSQTPGTHHVPNAKTLAFPRSLDEIGLVDHVRACG